MTDPRVRLIESVIIAALALVVACWRLDFALLLLGSQVCPLGLMMPVFASPCTSCTGTFPSNVQVTFTGVANGTCASCTALNATWQLTQVPATLPTICSYVKSDLSDYSCAGASGIVEAAYRGTASPVTDKYWAADHGEAGSGTGIAYFATASTESYPVPCADSHTGMACVENCVGRCDRSSATADFDPL